MQDARTTRNGDSPQPPRDQRWAAAMLAAYIHEISARHTAPLSADRSSDPEESPRHE
jgi:hypothetical protein